MTVLQPAEAQVAGGTRVAAVADVPPGWVLKVRVDSRELAIANCDGAITAMDNACTHAGGPLGDNRLKDGCFVECPWHNAVYDARTGEAVRGPARKGVKTYPVAVEGGEIFVALD